MQSGLYRKFVIALLTLWEIQPQAYLKGVINATLIACGPLRKFQYDCIDGRLRWNVQYQMSKKKLNNQTMKNHRFVLVQKKHMCLVHAST